MARYNKPTSEGPNSEDKALGLFAEMMIEKIQTIDKDWKKPWFMEGALQWPKNLNGREYNGMNAFMLLLQCEKQGWHIPRFCTFDCVQRLNKTEKKDANGEILPRVSVQKGEKSFPVFITTFTCIDKDTKERIKYDDYKRLSEEERKQYNVYPKMQVYRVFNVAQTNLQEARPEMWAKLETENVRPTHEQGEGEQFEFAPIDAMIKDNRWICPIKPTYGDNAYFSIGKNEIVVPEKQQFTDGEAFYGTLLHEITHSTGHESQLDRFKPTSFGSAEYAREELVAELGSALVAQRYGMAKHIKEDSAAYLKSWLESLKESPQFIKTTLLDVKKATSIINQHIDKIVLEQQEKLTEEVENNVDKTIADEKKGATYYASVAYLQSTDDTSLLDSLKDIGDYDRLLQEAKEYDQGDAIDLEHTYISAVQNRGDDVLVEDADYTVVYNGSVGGTYEVMRKVTEQEVRDNISRYGLPSETSKDVEEVGKAMITEDFSDLAKRKAPVFEMPSGDVLHLQYDREHDSFEVGTVTNAGLAVEHILSYDHSLSLADNIEDVYNTLSELPEYQLKEEYAEEENVAKATFRR
jgi:antirestriction protein ArdC